MICATCYFQRAEISVNIRLALAHWILYIILVKTASSLFRVILSIVHFHTSLV